MIIIRPEQDRGKASFGWLDSRHTFSFGNYYDPNYVGFSRLRVINEDRVIPSKGFQTHSHQNMEIISYVLSGTLEHKDSIGNGSIIRPGDVQIMSAGKGITHSEFNSSATELVHFLQIWIVPKQKNLEPSYEQKYFSLEQRQGKLRLIASPDGKDESITIHQDAHIYTGVFNNGDRYNFNTETNKSLWLQVAKGSLNINGKSLNSGDGVAITKEKFLELLITKNNSEILLFEFV